MSEIPHLIRRFCATFPGACTFCGKCVQLRKAQRANRLSGEPVPPNNPLRSPTGLRTREREGRKFTKIISRKGFSLRKSCRRRRLMRWNWLIGLRPAAAVGTYFQLSCDSIKSSVPSATLTVAFGAVTWLPTPSGKEVSSVASSSGYSTPFNVTPRACPP